MDLTRLLLIKLEAVEQPYPGFPTPLQDAFMDSFEGYSAKEIAFHVDILADGGFIVATSNYPASHYPWFRKITWQGHEFIAAIRDKEIWEQTKAAAKKGGTEALSVVWEIAKAYGKKKLKEATGLDV